MPYCEKNFSCVRRPTREVKVGTVGVGGRNPVRIQSMTTSDTRDVAATVEQIKKLFDSGCEIVRVTVQGMKEAAACEGIKNALLQQGLTLPLVADIHFYPPAAMAVVDFVDKVRINPGNFVDKRATFKTLIYDDASYAAELVRIEEKFSPLVEKCKRLGRAMRIGTNHGSLSDRIMNRFGDTPQGMVESALEFARVCRKLDYHDFMFSMKASNPLVMVQAYRLLVQEMYRLGWDYPLHLGVTEAGEGEDGRVKSAMGIGSLLLDGLGDTIRVSLTEDPWQEIDPCKRLISFAQSYEGKGVFPFEEQGREISRYQKRQVIEAYPLHRDGSVGVAIGSLEQLHSPYLFEHLGLVQKDGAWKRDVATVDFVLVSNLALEESDLQRLKQLSDVKIALVGNVPGAIPLLSLSESKRSLPLLSQMGPFVVVGDEGEDEWEKLFALNPLAILFSPTKAPVHQARRFFSWLHEKQAAWPVLLSFTYDCSKEDLLIQAPAEMGALLCDGLGEGVVVQGPFGLHALRVLGFNLLQSARMRTSKTEFISCPGCGRTLFNLQEVSEKIRQRTAHLPGVKIAIMGCIVNGPGEMADADFGYVGSKPHKIDLYVGKTCVEKDISFDEAPDRLVQLIKDQGRWQD